MWYCGPAYEAVVDLAGRYLRTVPAAVAGEERGGAGFMHALQIAMRASHSHPSGVKEIIAGMWPNRPLQWVGRENELVVLRAAVEALGRGEGTVVWVEGEPGIGKSALVTEALAAAAQPGWDVGWGGADQLTRLPLRVMQDCLQVRPGSPDPRRAHAAGLLRDRPSDGDASLNGIEILLTLVDGVCAAAPTVLVLDDLQWADEASLAVWHELAVSISQLRLLLIGTCRPTPRTPEVQQVRASVVRRSGQVITLGPLPEPDVAVLVKAIVETSPGKIAGASPGRELRRLTAQAAGNPLYVRELVDALLREQAVTAGPGFEAAPRPDQLPASLPVSLAGVLDDRLSSVSADAAQLLRIAALLGGRFSVTDLSVVARRPVSALAASLQEAVTAGIVDGAGAHLAFRHPLIRQALYESMPEALRMALHGEAARELAASGADTLSVAQQLTAAGRMDAGWAKAWLLPAVPALARRAPLLAVKLLQRELEETPADAEAWEILVVGLVQALLSVGDHPRAVRRASQALTVMADPARRGETSWMLAHAQVSAGHSREDAISTIRQALAAAGLPRVWQARLLAFLALLERGISSLDATNSIARRALTAAEEADDPSATAQALTDLWLTSSVGRDHANALDCIDRALQVVGDDTGHDDLRSAAMDARTFTLQNLDRWPQAELSLRQAREFALRAGRPDRVTWSSAAVLRYWLGQWDDALAELGSDATDAPGLVDSFLSFVRERWSALLVHGVAALIAGRREERTTAGKHLRAGLALPIDSLTDRENQDFLVAAHALSLEQSGETRQAMLRLAELIPRRDDEMTLVHQWLPDLVRLALTVGDRQQAQTAARACQDEAAAGSRPARAAAASLRCYGLLESDPNRLQGAVAHYRAVGPAVELPAALEDLAVVLAEHGDRQAARAALNEAVGLYEGMGARWDIRRAESRLRPHGIKRGVRGRRGPRPASGWAALTSTEVKIAALVARGDSTADIARSMFLSRRTVQTYISHILTKLGANGRADIVREALLQGVSP
jgi:DNA-binding CsgD family transcriptional regulator/tetratricopeptide (TPR) repeat protein